MKQFKSQGKIPPPPPLGGRGKGVVVPDAVDWFGLQKALAPEEPTISSIPKRNVADQAYLTLKNAGGRVGADLGEMGNNFANFLGAPTTKPINPRDFITPGKRVNAVKQFTTNLFRSGLEMAPSLAFAPVALASGVASGMAGLMDTGRGLRQGDVRGARQGLASTVQLVPGVGNMASEMLMAGDAKQGAKNYGLAALQNPAPMLFDFGDVAKGGFQGARAVKRGTQALKQGVSVAAPKLDAASSALITRGRQNLATPLSVSPSLGMAGGSAVSGAGARAKGAAQVSLGNVGRSLSKGAMAGIRQWERSKPQSEPAGPPPLNELGQVPRNPVPAEGYGRSTAARWGESVLDLPNRWEEGSGQFAIPTRSTRSTDVFPLEAFFRDGVINPDNILNAGPELWDGEAAGMQVRDPLTGQAMMAPGPRGGAPKPVLGQGGPLGSQTREAQAYRDSRGDGLFPGILGFTKQQIATSLNQAMRDNAPIRLIVRGADDMVRGNKLYTDIFRKSTENLIEQGKSSQDSVVEAARRALGRTQKKLAKDYERAMASWDGTTEQPRPSRITTLPIESIQSFDDVFAIPWDVTGFGFGARNAFYGFLGSQDNARAGITPLHTEVSRGIQDPRFRGPGGRGGLVVAATRLAIPDEYKGLQDEAALADAASKLTFQTGQDGIPGHRSWRFGALSDQAGILPSGIARDELWTKPEQQNFLNFFGDRPLLNVTPEFLEQIYGLPAGELSGGRFYDTGGYNPGGAGAGSNRGAGPILGDDPNGRSSNGGSLGVAPPLSGSGGRGITGGNQLPGEQSGIVLPGLGQDAAARPAGGAGLPLNPGNPGATTSGPVPRPDPLAGFDISSTLGAFGALDPKLFDVVRNVLGSTNKDFNFLHRFASPLSISDGAGNTMVPGSYERIAGRQGKQVSDVFRDLQAAVEKGEGESWSLQTAKARLEYLYPAMEGEFPGLVEEAKRHIAEIESEFYRVASQRARKPGLTEDERLAASAKAAKFVPYIKPYERAAGTVIAAASEAIGKPVADPDFAIRRMVDKAAQVNSILKLKYNVKSSAVNLVQPLETLWPRVSSADYAAIVAESLKPATKKRLQEMGVLDGPTKLEGELASGKRAYADPELAAAIAMDEELAQLASFLEADFAVAEADGTIPEGTFDKPAPTRVPLTMKERLAAFSPFSAASGQNRSIGYLYGELDARRKGITNPDEVHQNGLAWAEMVEFDNSIYNMPPVMRDTMSRLLFQYKGFTIKAIENLANLMADAKTPQERAARLAKWGAQKAAVGGVKALAAPLSMVGVGSAAVYFAAKQRAKDQGMDEDEAEKVAQAMYYGAPSMLGMDLSSSVSMLDEPFGNSTAEQAVNFWAGPTVGSAISLEQMRRDGKSPMDMVGKLSPYVRQAKGAAGLVDTLRGNRPPDLFGMVPAKDKQRLGDFGTRPATTQESALRTLAVPLATTSAAGANLEAVKALQGQLGALLMEQATLEDPTIAGLSESETRQVKAKLLKKAERIRSLEEAQKTIKDTQKTIERLKARGAIKRGFGVGAPVTPLPPSLFGDRG